MQNIYTLFQVVKFGNVLPYFANIFTFWPLCTLQFDPWESCVCMMKTGAGEERRKKTIPERARGHFNYFSFALAFWSFPIKIWCKTARLSWSATISSTRGRTTSNKPDKAKNCGAICRHFYSQKKYTSKWHSSMKILAIIKWNGKFYIIDFLFTVILRTMCKTKPCL